MALAAEAGRFDQLRRELFANQPAESTGGFTASDLIDLGARAGLVSPEFEQGVHDLRYKRWVLAAESQFQQEDPQGTPAGILDGRPVDQRVLYDPERLGALVRR